MTGTENTLERRTLLRALPLLPFSSGLSTALLQALQPASSGAVPFLERTRLEPGTRVSSGLAGRLSFDLRRLATDGLIVANEDFYIRTGVPDAVERRKGELDDWMVRFTIPEDATGHQIQFGGPDREISARQLRRRARPMGRHLLECSGNSSRHRFGLLSVAEWSGVPLEELFEENMGNFSRSMLFLVTGNDELSEERRGSVRGASWVFTYDQIERAGAFLATHMNGELLPLDHGSPVRLVMPGWYGCSCIKWVESIEGVSAEHPSTSQMIEFSGRTHQDGEPELARDFAPAEIDFAAMPILVEGPDPRGSFAVTGVAWGNPAGVSSLLVGIGDVARQDDPDSVSWRAVDEFEPPEPSSWSLWQHRFTPPRPSEYEITLRVGEPDVRTRRLDSGYYARRVRV